MKKSALLNQEVSNAIAGIGHGDMMAIVDCGYPIPEDVKRIDLALKRGTPGFLETLDTILDELSVQRIIIANEIIEQNSDVYKELMNRFPTNMFEMMLHEDFKQRARNSKAIVRTGENTAFSNILLVADVWF